MYQREDEDEDKDYFPQSDVINLKMENLSKLYSRQQIWFILFYKANDREFKDLQEMWKKLAEKNSGETNDQATTGVMILPWTSVSRKSRPE